MMQTPDEVAGKQALREQMLYRRTHQDPKLAAEYNECAQQALLAHPSWHTAQQVALYTSVNGEVETNLLIKDAWRRGIQMLLPRCIPHQKGKMEFVACTSLNDLQIGTFGIWEPRPELPAIRLGDEHEFDPDVLVAPGLAFDKKGTRLGYGGGYYDRFLQCLNLVSCLCVGLAYSWQIVEYIPKEPWDLPVQCVCTERGLQWI